MIGRSATVGAVVVLTLIGPQVIHGMPATRPPDGLRIVYAGDLGVILDLSVPPAMDAAAFGASLTRGAADDGQWDPGAVEGGRRSLSAVEDVERADPGASLPGTTPPIRWQLGGELGRPALPEAGLLLGVPPTARVSVQVLADDALHLPGQVDLPPVQVLAPAPEGAEVGRPVAVATAPDPGIYGHDALYPEAVARITDDAWLRDQRVVRLAVHPYQYNPARRTVHLHRHVRLAVTFTAPAVGPGTDDGPPAIAPTAARARSAPSTGLNPFEAALRTMLLNGEVAKRWRTASPPVTGAVGGGTTAPAMDRAIDRPDGPGAQLTQSGEGSTRYRIRVDRDAMVQVTYADLKAAGMAVDAVDPRQLALSSQGQDVAIEVRGEADGRFDPGDALVFYGQRFRGQPETIHLGSTAFPGIVTEGKYTDTRVYWLAAEGPPGPRMPSVDASPTDTLATPANFPAVARFDEPRFWWTYHWINDDTWFSDRISINQVVTRSYAIDLPGLAGPDAAAAVRARFAARSGGTAHHIRLSVNQVPAGELRWDGVGGALAIDDLPQSALREGSNSVDLTVLLDPARTNDDIYFDWLEIAYPRRFGAVTNTLAFALPTGERRQYAIDGFDDPAMAVYDLSVATRPVRLDGVRRVTAGRATRAVFEAAGKIGAPFLAVATSALAPPQAMTRVDPPATDWRDPSHGADYIIITHPEFRAAADRLASHRKAEGMRVAVVDLDAAFFDAFSDGIYTPRAIRSFLAWAYAQWQPPAPAYVVLLGDGHFNLKHFPGEYGNPPPIYMPPNLEFVDPVQGEVDSSNRLAAIVGDDVLPDMAIGRIPVTSAAEAEAVVDKIIAYERAGPQAWGRRHLFVADDTPDSAGDFVALSEQMIAQSLPPGAKVDRIYLDDFLDRTCGGEICPEGVAAARNAITSTLNITGALLVNFIGHGALERWTHQAIFSNPDVAALHNGDRLPVVLSWTCLDGYWDHPSRTSLAETLLRAPDAGAVATFSPTGLGVATGHHILGHAMVQAMAEKGARLGPASVAGKLALFGYSSVYYRSLIDTYTVVGDPALLLQIPTGPEPPPPARAYLPSLGLCYDCVMGLDARREQRNRDR